MELRFSGEVWWWKGPAPFHFVTVPDAEAAELRAASSLVSYGWGVIPVAVQVGRTRWTTSLFPKQGGYLVPLKDAVRAAEGIELGDTVALRLTVDVERAGRR
ncbi:DUF1905 domain-containing protein [Cellulomonas fimi]|uniref:DUF1905 domain-containing protein n=1 Tax=Cellulomonas fimi (strain ATCC 484 / DSM 20113 / JCM 1341 / CCUG 24087 / LMG 16345 / NBRC 15513 / NCIMB 8980 / NCTC 7547 / NRS-133) TaxID=590998 RepID=F4H5C8_CELFA|nr:DUF1905 domain-containing protein [Cellulomonas fimi]AEE47851.1 Domain of unknown function DUF1905 [Cellulomonas fimi ATCC 484]NNH06011.1 DUF1905 domain-containing protein [Cellulomonas fimi]